MSDSLNKNQKLSSSHENNIQNESPIINIENIAKIGGWYHEFNTGHFFWTDGHYDLFELPKHLPQEELFKQYQARIHHDDLEQIKYLVGRARDFGEDYNFNHRLFFDDGQRIKYVKDIARVNKDSLGKPISLSGVCQDVTDKVLKQDQNQFALQSFGVGLWHYDFLKKKLVWDESTYKLYNLNPAQFTSAESAWKSVVSPETLEQASVDVQNAVQENKEYFSLFKIQLPDQQTRHIGIRGKIIRNNDGIPLKMYGMSWDRTQEIQLEKSLEIEKAKSIHNAKLASLGEMSASVAHEINNPLAVISAALQLLKKVKDDPEKFENKLDTIKKSITRISKIVNGLRKFSKSASNTAYTEESLDKIINEALQFIDFKIQKFRIDIKVHIKDNFNIICDSIEIQQVIINLISNSIDAIKNYDQKWIEINAFKETNVSNDKAKYILQVIDSGTGIPESETDKIFQPFYTTKQLGEGTGLGLSIAKGILDQHKAKILVNRSFKNTCIEVHFSEVNDVLQTDKIAA